MAHGKTVANAVKETERGDQADRRVKMKLYFVYHNSIKRKKILDAVVYNYETAQKICRALSFVEGGYYFTETAFDGEIK